MPAARSVPLDPSRQSTHWRAGSRMSGYTYPSLHLRDRERSVPQVRWGDAGGRTRQASRNKCMSSDSSAPLLVLTFRGHSLSTFKARLGAPNYLLRWIA